jgi:ElaB/YqjD/DUF883 family membrane-anchored ribosome-binding protein
MDDAIKAVPAGEENSYASRSDGPESRPAVSQEIDSLLQYLVDRAHEAVDRLAERAAPALGQFAENLVQGAEQIGLAGGSDDDARLPDEAGRSLAMRSRSAGGYLGMVRQHPMAALALAVAAGIVIRQMRTR